MHDVRLYLEAIDPRLWHVVVGAVVFAVIYAWRKISPSTFDALPPKAQALPAIILGVVISESSSANFTGMLIDAIFGAFSGWQAIGSHEFLKTSPGPYGTATKEQTK